MSKRSSPGSTSAVGDDLDCHMAGFLATLDAAGYAESTQHEKRRALLWFIGWARKTGRAVANLDEECVGRFLKRRTRRRRKYRDAEYAGLLQFIRHLRTVGVTPCRCSAASPAEVLLRSYVEHLISDRGLCPRSLKVYSPFVRAFVEAHQLPEHAGELDASAVRSYLLDRSRSRSVSFVRLLASALRSFLHFFFLNGATMTDLSLAVPPVRRWRSVTTSPLLTPEEVDQVIAATDRSTGRGLRAFAILLLLARLGLRAGEVAALELEDIRWSMGEIVVRGKGRVHDRLPLLDEVGEALARYLRDARGPSTSRSVFLRHYAPRVGLSGPTAVILAAREALRRAGLRPSGRVGAHVFRYSLATRMIQHGASLAEISKVLRHRSSDTTRLYAKIDLGALRDVALPWPRSMEAHR